VAVLGVISIIVYQLCYKMTTERVVSVPNKNKKVNVGKTVKSLFKNRPFLALCLASMLLIAVQQYTQTTYNYLFLNYFQKPQLYSLVTVFTYLPMALLLPVLQKIVRRFGKKEVCAIGMVLSFAANLVLWLIHTKSVVVFFVLCFLSGLGMTFFVLEIWALVTDVIDYQEILSGQRDEGTSYAFFSFTRKLGQTIAGVLGTGVLTMIGYDAKAVTAEAVQRLYTVSTALPAVMCLVMALSLGILYPLTKKKLEEMHGSKGLIEE
ncbi:MAG: MFS transporter, partial [Clostridia bacterium]|nr:MFS transporter [Clostridia bacterium]